MSQPSAANPRSRIALRALVALVALGVVLVAAFVWWRSHALEAAHERFRRAIAPALTRGEPLGVFDLEAASSSSREPGRGLLRALADLSYARGDASAWPDGPWSLEPAEAAALDGDARAALAAFVAELDDFYAQVAESAASERLLFPMRRDAAGFVEWVPMEELLAVRDLLAARALCAATETERVDALVSLLRLGRRLEPRTALHVLVRANLVDTAARHTLDGLAAGRLASGARERLDPLLRPSTIAVYPTLLRAERAWSLSVHDAFVDLPHVDEGAPASLVSHAAPGMEELESGFAEAYVVDSAAEVMELCERLLALPLEDPAGLIDGAHHATRALRESDRSWWLPWPDVRELLGRGIAGLGARTPERLVAIEHRTRLARLALAAAEHRARHGAWPERLDSIDGVPVLQPLGGLPFPHERRPDGSLRIGGAGGPFAESDAGVTVPPR